MKYKVIILPRAEVDLKEIYTYLLGHFSRKEWEAAYKKIKQSIEQLKAFPESGAILKEIQHLDLIQYRQIIAGMNRIVYEIRNTIVYIHIICDVRKSMSVVLARRLLLN